METDFAAQLAEWNGFYSAVAGASATLVGLLFVSLALRPEIMGDRGPAGMQRWAGQTFHDFVMLLSFSLIALIPATGPIGFGAPLAILGTMSLVQTARAAIGVRADPDPRWRGRSGVSRFLPSLLGYGICVWVGNASILGDAEAIDWLIAVVFLLVVSAASSCWDLLKALGEMSRSGAADKSS